MRDPGTSGWICAVAALSLLVACGPELTPEEEIDLARSHFEVQLTSWTVIQEPAAPDQSAEEEVSADGGEVSADSVAEPIEVVTEILLDILVSMDVDDPGLEGVTIDLTQVDSEMNEKARYTLWIEKPSTSRATGSQLARTLEDVDYAPGDMFHVEVRVPVPADQRSEYREFDFLP